MSAGGNISMSKQFGVDFHSEVVVVSLCTKDAQIAHSGVNRGTSMIWCLERTNPSSCRNSDSGI